MQWSGVQQKQKRNDYNTGDWSPEPELSGAMPRTIRPNKGLILLRRAVIALLVMMLAGYIWPLLVRSIALSQGTSSDAVIEKLYTQYTQPNNVGVFTMYFFEISYLINSETKSETQRAVVQVTTSFYFKHDEGDTIGIRYLPTRPSWVALENDSVVTKWTVGAVAALLLFVWWGLHSSLKGIVRLMASGDAVKGIVVDISGGKATRTRAHIYYEYDNAAYTAIVEVRRPAWKIGLREGKVITLLVDPKHKTGSILAQRMLAYPYIRGFEVV
jgi:hypothetical protein